MTAKDQTPAKALDELKRVLADTPAWRALVRFVDRHPLFSLLALPVVLIGLGIHYAATGHYLESGLIGAVVIWISTGLRR